MPVNEPGENRESPRAYSESPLGMLEVRKHGIVEENTGGDWSEDNLSTEGMADSSLVSMHKTPSFNASHHNIQKRRGGQKQRVRKPIQGHEQLSIV